VLEGYEDFCCIHYVAFKWWNLNRRYSFYLLLVSLKEKACNKFFKCFEDWFSLLAYMN
jgi:hypothetical protein